MKRTREVYPTDQIAHMWAHQHDSPNPVNYARNPQGNFWYQGDTIYSYGTHFPIAKLVKNRRDPNPIVLFTTRSYSNTTSKHIGEVRGAANHLTTFRVHDVNDPTKTFADKAKSIKGLLKEAKKTKSVVKANGLLENIKQIVHDVNRWRDYRGIAGRIQVPKEVDPLLVSLEPKLNEHKARVAAAAETKRVNRQKRWEEMDARRRGEMAEYERWKLMPEHEQKADFMARLEEWEVGASVEVIRVRNPFSTPWMRVRRPHSQHAFVETTMGVCVPLHDVEKVWKQVQNVRTNGSRWERNGEVLPVGHYWVDSIETDGTLHAGCHHFSAEAILRLATKLGWYTQPEYAPPCCPGK